MTRKKKKSNDEVEEDLLFYFANLSTVTIYGKVYNRVRYDGSKGKSCPGCHTDINALHWVACKEEYCPYCKGFSIDCSCDPDINNAETDLHLQCIDSARVC